jgi:hypothetical protein
MNQYQITSQNRPVRVLYLVDESATYKQIVDLIHANLGLWGGRYNPIVPLKDGKVADGYVEMLKYYDPDHVYYSKGVDEQVAKGVVGGNACEYERMTDDHWRRYAKGLNVYHLLSKYNRNHWLLLNESIKGRDWPLADYYRINFGFGDTLLYGEQLLCEETSANLLGDADIKDLHKHLVEDGCLTRSDLSSTTRTAPAFRPKHGWSTEAVKIVIAKDDSGTTDLLYYWNYEQFDMGRILFCTVDQFKSLIQDPNFFRLLDKGGRGHKVDLVSQTLNNQELSDLITTNPAALNRNTMFQVQARSEFPYEIDHEHTMWFRGSEPVQVHTMVSEEGVYYLPKLSFIDVVADNFQHWVVDVSIDRAGNGSRQQMRFPRTANCRGLFSMQDVRVNRNRNVSVTMWSQTAWKETTTLRIPPSEHRLNQLLTRPFYQGAEHKSGYETVRRSDDSNRLSGFFGLFQGHFSSIETYFRDKFWVDVFEECCKSERAVGDTIEFADLLDLCVATMQGQCITLDGHEQPYHNTANLKEGLRRTLEELCNYRVFLKGYALKCATCASKFWYHLSEVGEAYECKGCLTKNDIPVEARMAYKLNELVRKNIYRTTTSPDGNMTVIRTLVRLWSREMTSFEYSPQMSLYKEYGDSQPIGDLDIICISNGQLIIGESKHDSAAFKSDRTSLDRLVEVVKVLRPDQVVLSCSVDNNGRLSKEVAYVETKLKIMSNPPPVEGIPLIKPDYDAFHGSHYFPL